MGRNILPDENHLRLRFATGFAEADATLQTVVTRFEQPFAGRIQGYYLTGSYASGDAQPTSDLDLCVVFVGALGGDERAAAMRLAAELRATASTELELEVEDEAGMQAGVHPSFLLGSQLVYSATGDDIRPRATIMPLDVWTRDRMLTSYWRLIRLFGRPTPVRYPLSYPTPDDEFYGYIGSNRRLLRLPDGREVPCTRDLLRATGWEATALLAYRAGVYVGAKRDLPGLYRRHLGGEWADLLTDLHEQCARRWRYLIPNAKEDRARLRSLCADALGFENHFLLACREYMSAELKSADDIRRAPVVNLLNELPLADDAPGQTQD